EQGAEQASGNTGRGIGPCYQDKVGRVSGIRIGDLLYPEYLRERLDKIVPRKNGLLRALAAEARTFEAQALADEYLAYAQRMRPFISDTALLLQQAVRAGKRILFEAAQGSLLDVDDGTYPYVTSLISWQAGIWRGS